MKQTIYEKEAIKLINTFLPLVNPGKKERIFAINASLISVGMVIKTHKPYPGRVNETYNHYKIIKRILKKKLLRSVEHPLDFHGL